MWVDTRGSLVTLWELKYWSFQRSSVRSHKFYWYYSYISYIWRVEVGEYLMGFHGNLMIFILYRLFALLESIKSFLKSKFYSLRYDIFRLLVSIWCLSYFSSLIIIEDIFILTLMDFFWKKYINIDSYQQVPYIFLLFSRSCDFVLYDFERLSTSTANL